ncbi:DUF397 domain-containing protein [Streptomyces sp. NPDC056470]|uniref:DUF397 domain-containing protein n=1 Tax=Streptomyces sp. NPDC056470 TaxID=3345831 RepID=UPI0036B05AEE
MRRPPNSWNNSPESSQAINTHRDHQPSTEIAPESAWFKSSHSSDGTGNCLEAANLPATVAVRDSKDKLGPALVFTRGSWSAFVMGLTGDSLTPSVRA